MKIINQPRRSGKSTELIKLSHEKWYYIVCLNRQRAEQINKDAQRLGLEIPYPLIVEDLPVITPYVRGILIDDLDQVLQELIGTTPIIVATTSCEVEIK